MSEWLWKEVCPGARGWSRVTEENEGLGEGEGCKAREQRMGTLDEGEPREKPAFEWPILLLVLPGPFPLRKDAQVLPSWGCAQGNQSQLRPPQPELLYFS